MRSKKVLLNIISNLILQAIIIIYGFIVPKIILSSFGSEVNGLVSSITQLLGYITLLESGLGPVVLSLLYKPIAEKKQDEIEKILKTSEKFFRKIAIIFIIYIIGLSLVYPIIVQNSFEKFYTISLILIISISTFAEYYFGMIYKLYIQAEQKQYIISVIQIITYILSILFIVILAKVGSTIHIIKLASGMVFTIRPILQNLYVKKKYNIRLKNKDSKFIIEKRWDGLAQHIAFVIHTNTDITVLTLFSTLENVSIYSVYYLVVSGIKKIILAFTSGIESTFGNIIAKGETYLLCKRFNTFEIMYNIISTIAFSSTFVLITPFVEIYTYGINDANYIQELFGFLLVLSEYIWIIRQPFNMLIKAAGHFKETRVGAWIECISNIVLSIILVRKFGLIGVAIGTIIAMTIRTIEFIYYTNTNILKRKNTNSIAKLLVIMSCTTIVILIGKLLYINVEHKLINWIIYAIKVVAISSIVTLTINYIFYKREFSEIKNIFMKTLTRKVDKHE